MADYELLKGRVGEARYIAVRPPLNEDQCRRVASALKASSGCDDLHVAQVADTTEFYWDGITAPELSELDKHVTSVVETLGRLGYTAALADGETIFLDGPEDIFTQFEKQYARR